MFKSNLLRPKRDKLALAFIKLEGKYPYIRGRGIIFLFLVAALLGSCSTNVSSRTKGNSSLQGIWQETLSPEKRNPENLEYSKYEFRFSCDSLYIITEIHSKYNYEDAHCLNHGTWKEYQKAGYSLKDDSLFLEGVYTKPNFKMKISGCYHNGNFHDVFILRQFKTTLNNRASFMDSLIISSPHEDGIIHLHRVQNIPCTLK